MGQFTVDAPGVDTMVRGTGVAAQELRERLTPQEYNEVVNALGVVYLTALNGIAVIIRVRHGTFAEAEPTPPVLPLELVLISECDFITLVRTHKKRIVDHFAEEADMMLESICDQQALLRQCVSEEPDLQRCLQSASNLDFNLAWAPAGPRFHHLQSFVAGLATVMSTTSRVEGDFSRFQFYAAMY